MHATIRTLSLLVAVGAATAALSAEPGRKPVALEPASNIYETVVESGHLQKFVMAVEAAGLVDTLKGDGPLTVFVPSNEAFERLTSAAFHDLLHPEHKEKLKALLLAHVIPGQLRMTDLKQHMEIRSAGGPKLDVDYQADHAIAGSCALRERNGSRRACLTSGGRLSRPAAAPCSG
jgi:uncharacterized surface protein with fasciclin (FAS1) repeats